MSGWGNEESSAVSFFEDGEQPTESSSSWGQDDQSSNWGNEEASTDNANTTEEKSTWGQEDSTTTSNWGQEESSTSTWGQEESTTSNWGQEESGSTWGKEESSTTVEPQQDQSYQRNNRNRGDRGDRGDRNYNRGDRGDRSYNRGDYNNRDNNRGDRKWNNDENGGRRQYQRRDYNNKSYESYQDSSSTEQQQPEQTKPQEQTPQQLLAPQQEVNPVQLQFMTQIFHNMMNQHLAPFDPRLTDCPNFLKGNCELGSSCINRHNPSAKTNPICNYWKLGTCRNLACVYKHPQPSFNDTPSTGTTSNDTQSSGGWGSEESSSNDQSSWNDQSNGSYGGSKERRGGRHGDRSEPRGGKREPRESFGKQVNPYPVPEVTPYHSASVLAVSEKDGKCYFLVGREESTQYWTSVGAERGNSDKDARDTAARGFSEITKSKVHQRDLKYQKSILDEASKHRMFIHVIPYVEKERMSGNVNGIVELEWITWDQMWFGNWENEQLTDLFANLIALAQQQLEEVIQQLTPQW